MSNKPPAGQFRLLYFASAASFTGKASEDFTAPLPIADLFSVIETRHPGITVAVLSSAAITVNLNYVDIESVERTSSEGNSIVIKEGDEVAIIPPVSSG